ncbi:MAG: hypothetical protein EU530_04085 [Promethearchaeota archaeon]|nr:MAG: hypothetical protein EU530_04085 [Candidatus Lokiarchaeota archaeon]
MKKLVKYWLWGTFAWWIVVFLIFVFITPIPEIVLQLREVEKIIPAGFYLALSIFAFFMMFKMIKKMQEKEDKSGIADSLFGFFLLSGASALIQGLFGIIEFTVRDLQVFFTDSTFIFISGTGFMLTIFMIELFWKEREHNQNIGILVGIGIIILFSYVGISLNIILELNDIFLYIPTALLFVATILIYLLLIINSFKIYRYLEKSIEKRSLLRIGLSGIFMIIGFILVLIYIFLDEFYVRIANAVFLMIGYYLLFRGFTRPIRKSS